MISQIFPINNVVFHFVNYINNSITVEKNVYCLNRQFNSINELFNELQQNKHFINRHKYNNIFITCNSINEKYLTTDYLCYLSYVDGKKIYKLPLYDIIMEYEQRPNTDTTPINCLNPELINEINERLNTEPIHIDDPEVNKTLTKLKEQLYGESNKINMNEPNKINMNEPNKINMNEPNKVINNKLHKNTNINLVEEYKKIEKEDSPINNEFSNNNNNEFTNNNNNEIEFTSFEEFIKFLLQNKQNETKEPEDDIVINPSSKEYQLFDEMKKRKSEPKEKTISLFDILM